MKAWRGLRNGKRLDPRAISPSTPGCGDRRTFQSPRLNVDLYSVKPRRREKVAVKSCSSREQPRRRVSGPKAPRIGNSTIEGS